MKIISGKIEQVQSYRITQNKILYIVLTADRTLMWCHSIMYHITDTILPGLILVCGLDVFQERYTLTSSSAILKRYTRVHAYASISGVMIASVAVCEER